MPELETSDIFGGQYFGIQNIPLGTFGSVDEPLGIVFRVEGNAFSVGKRVGYFAPRVRIYNPPFTDQILSYQEVIYGAGYAYFFPEVTFGNFCSFQFQPVRNISPYLLQWAYLRYPSTSV